MDDEARTEPDGDADATAKVHLGSVAVSQRYERAAQLGAGGMGIVHLCRDVRLRRDVAMKTLPPSSASEGRARALLEREAQIQGRLEHPAIVPVYDSDVAPDGSPAFTMRRIEGTSLRTVFKSLRAGDTADLQRYGRRRLLGAFSTVCAAVAYAHARGVLHRDIKPDNVMLGEFGEVYLLDFGVAQSATETDGYRRGDLVGTPGYVAPEQARGEPVDERADVYSLGAVLYELLTLERLHSGDALAALRATALKPDVRERLRTIGRDVPIELEDLCVHATAHDPAARIASARELHDAVERILDGERDLARRKESAVEHAARARARLHASFASTHDAAGAREEAMEEAHRALTLDPSNAEARTVVAAVAIHTRPGPEATDAQQNAITGIRRVLSLTGILLFIPLFVGMGLTSLLGVRSWVAAMAAVATTLVAAGVLVYRLQNDALWVRVLAFCGCMAAALWSAAVFGPFLVLPGMLAVFAVAFTIATLPSARASREPRSLRALAMAGTVATLLVPVGLEAIGFVPPSMAFRDGVIVLLPRIVEYPPGTTLLYLIVVNATLVLVPAFLVTRVRDYALDVERSAFETASRLRQLLPREARAASEDAAVMRGDDT